MQDLRCRDASNHHERARAPLEGLAAPAAPADCYMMPQPGRWHRLRRSSPRASGCRWLRVQPPFVEKLAASAGWCQASPSCLRHSRGGSCGGARCSPAARCQRAAPPTPHGPRHWAPEAGRTGAIPSQTHYCCCRFRWHCLGRGWRWTAQPRARRRRLCVPSNFLRPSASALIFTAHGTTAPDAITFSFSAPAQSFSSALVLPHVSWEGESPLFSLSADM